MATLATAITITNAIPRIVSFRTLYVDDKDEAKAADGVTARPYAVVAVQVYGPNKKDAQNNAIPYSNPYGPIHRLQAYDSGESLVLRKNSAPQTALDEVQIQPAVVAGLYTAITNAWNGNVSGSGKTRKRCEAVDAIAVSSGLLGPEFAAS